MGCDGRCRAILFIPGRLSVSSNGSNGLRLPENVRHQFDPSAFSILERIEWAATLSLISTDGKFGSFSILERIEWAATPAPGGGGKRGRDFQYPRTDRMGCDLFTSFSPAPTLRLSVSSNGSNGLRHDMTSFCVTDGGGFQYPRTDRMGCDPDLRRLTAQGDLLFQYPRTDRMGCDRYNTGGVA